MESPSPFAIYAVRRPKWYADAIKWLDAAKRDLERGDRVDALDSLRMATDAIRRGLPSALRGPKS